ncbi:hypothetical protein CDD83_9324 [Cordyceps sp. RAO-2017]|nr:hypothetical protein CDD83_9324 [Cordyceps sp. RAO-2017]
MSGDRMAGVDHLLGENKIGVKTPSLMIVSYLLAITLAVVHYCFFLAISGSAAEGPGPHLPQTYSTTISILLANGFGLALRFSLSIAFTQYLWKLVRVTPMRLSTIDNLFSLRATPTNLLDFTIVSQASPLAFMAIIIWTMPIFTGFPAGAMTVSPTQKHQVMSNVSVPTFNASYATNWTWPEPADSMLVPIKHDVSVFGAGSKIWPLWDQMFEQAKNFPLRQVVEATIVSGNAGITLSPEASNISYTTTFYGPYLNCTSSDGGNFTIKDLPALDNKVVAMNATLKFNPTHDWDYDGSSAEALDPCPVELTLVHNDFKELSRFVPPVQHGYFVTLTATATRRILRCKPVKALYRAYHQYENSVGRVQVSIVEHSIAPLTKAFERINLTSELPSDISTLPGMVDMAIDANLMALIVYMAQGLSGSLEARLAVDFTGPEVYTHNGRYQKYAFGLHLITLDGNPASRNNSLVRFTEICKYFRESPDFIRDPAAGRLAENLRIDLNADILNAVLVNITLSTISHFKRWQSPVDINKTTWVTSYSFSRPENLILPYTIAILCSLPLIALGLLALYSNGVPAIDGGVFQLLMTTRGSRMIDELAARGSLGGEENIPPELKKLEVQYGRLPASRVGCRTTEGHIGPIAGFGATIEVVPLRKAPRK